MDKIQKILNHNLYNENLKLNCAKEADRIFCHHDMVHFLDVCRIAYILNLEEKIGIKKELIYATGLLHDIGKHLQYEKQIPHEKASAEIAALILKDCGFEEKETSVILSAILSHRDEKVKSERNLNGIIYRADKLSRACFSCASESECYWKENKKNMELIF